MKTALVLGAAGGIGGAVARAFAERGWRVLGLVRAGRERALPADVIPLAVDLFDSAAVARAAGKVDVVFNGLNAPYHQWDAKIPPLFTAALDIAERLDAVHLFPGNVYNFGAGMPVDLTPDTPFAPTSGKGRIRVIVERIFAERAAAGRVRTFVMRGGDFFGPGSRISWMNAIILKRAAKGIVTPMGDPAVSHAYAFLPDLAAAFVQLAEARDRLGAYEVFHFAGHTASVRDLAAAVGTVTGRPVRIGRPPRLLFALLGLFSPVIRAAGEMEYLWNVPHRLVDDRLEAVVGQLAVTPLTKAVADEMRASA